ncbi:MAG: manganese efflux pump [Lachnospiraceae bacterium]|nr:manganese efflux pump [Lachnospiraceae bacterium]
MMWLQIMIFSLSVSIDALGIGISYGVQGIKIDKRAVAAVGCISAGMMEAAIFFGSRLAQIFPGKLTTICGAIIMLALGLWFLLQNLQPKGERKYDKDNSRHIDFREGIVLGTALSLDSLSTGIAAAASGLNSLLLGPVVGLMQAAFLSIGVALITRIPFLKQVNSRQCGIASGIILMGIGIGRLLG